MADEKVGHPLDPCDPDMCYQTMMSERTALITARRESEDNLIKTVVQLAAALIALMAGFVSQARIEFSGWSLVLFGMTLLAMVVSIIAGLTEHYFASKAYLEQQKLVEDFFQKKIATFGDPPSNKWVRKAQLTAFLTFVAALLSLSMFALVKAGESNVESQGTTTAAKTGTTAAKTGATTAQTGATTTQAGAAASTGSRVPALSGSSSHGRRDTKGRDTVGGSINATAPAPEKVKR